LISPLDALLKQLRRWPLPFYLLPLVVWMGAIFWLSSQPHPFDLSETWLESLLGVSGHVVGYAGLALLWWRTLAAHSSASVRQALLLAFLLTVLYAASDEYHQTFVPGRNGTPADLLIDAAGAALGLWLAHRRQKRLSRKSN
jgi:VanZ family protein